MNINDFCDPGETREFCQKPFNINDRTIATNGQIMISIQKQDGHQELVDKPRKKVLEILSNIVGVGFEPIPELTLPEPMACNTCKGIGKATITGCLECEGEGTVDLSNKYNTYNIDCKTCGGEGELSAAGGRADCPYCRGKRETYKGYHVVAVGDIHVDAKYLRILMDEGGVEIATDKDKKMLFFKQGDTVGIMMGMRV